jgi:hypothetical protein
MPLQTSRERARLAAARTPAAPPACPVCPGLECHCRPRYFAGQVLDAADLNADQAYIRHKQRLHNLYLHGWGVVCGLEVVCHPDCEGWVRVGQGYAISPCGDDVVVCRDEDVDVLARIRQCCGEERRRRPDDCTPYGGTQADCGDTDGCWYLILAYEETPTRAMTALHDPHTARTPCACGPRGSAGCGCGGNGCGSAGCGCAANGNGATATNGYGAAATMVRGPARPACEPTRICEGYRLELCRAPDEPEPTYQDLLGGTLLGAVYACLAELQELLAKAPDPNANISVGQRFSACKRFLAEVRAFFAAHQVTRCEQLDQVAALTCPQPPAGDGDPVAYAAAVEQTVQQVRELLAAYLVDCVCLKLLPPCPVDPGDDRIILACITVEDSEVRDVCNLKGRRTVWSAPAVAWWLSAVPFQAAVSRVLERLCCGEYGFGAAEWLLGQRYLAREVTPMSAKADEVGLLASSVRLLGLFAEAVRTGTGV